MKEVFKMEKKFYVHKGVGQKSGKPYTALVLDLGYRCIWLSYSASDCAEALGISVAEIYSMENGIYPIF